MFNMNEIVGNYDILFITLDTLRYDVAVREEQRGNLPNLCGLGKWEKRHSPGSFTYAAHHAFFAGFLPTPASPGKHGRLFAARFPGSETTGGNTFVFDSPHISEGLAARGYRTICVGGVGFFNKNSPLGSVLPSYFQESYWCPEFGVTDPDSTENQVTHCIEVLSKFERNQRVFLFLNVSALHQPNYFYFQGAKDDSIESHAAALRYVDTRLGPLFQVMRERGPVFCIVFSDHGTAYGEDGYQGHRLCHEVVWTVPYREFIL
ncbi:MAG: STM4013/SEN3800 family hydrolase [Clostridia bacterium]|nr:STM4013/SEN3800 family hydrolase [Clostridia bacterium]